MMKTSTMKVGHSAGKTNMTTSVQNKTKHKTSKYKNDLKETNIMCTYNDERDEKQGYAPREKEATVKKSRQILKQNL